MKPKLSIVTTLYCSEAYIREFHSRSSAVAQDFAGDDYEIVMVNDGSPDDSLTVAAALTESDPHLLVVDLSRNFGHHKAILCGLEYARGDVVFLLDVDLEEEPEWLSSFAGQLNVEKCDVVFGVQETRKGKWFERWSGRLYYRVLSVLCNVNHPENITTARLMTRRFVDALLRHVEYDVVFSCLCVLTGFTQRPQLVRKLAGSPTTYSLWRKIRLAMKTILSFSDFPLQLIFYVGLGIFGISLLYGVYLLIQRLLMGQMLSGWTSLMLSIWMLGGLIILFLSVIGSYLSRMFIESKKRPRVIVRAVLGGRNCNRDDKANES